MDDVPIPPEENQPPYFSSQCWDVTAPMGDELELDLAAYDPESDEIEVRVDGLPPGATVHGSTLRWKPRGADIGLHTATVTVSDGRAETTMSCEIRVIEQWSTGFVPGAAYTMYLPGNAASVYHGPQIEVLLFSWAERTEHFGPSHARVSLDVALLQAPQKPEILVYSLGGDATFEDDPGRRVAIPYFGMDFGGVYVVDEPHVAFAAPVLGLYAYASRDVSVDVSGRYLLTTGRLEELRGWQIQAGLNFTMW